MRPSDGNHEAETLKSQFAISKPRRGGRRTNPYVFTEEGVEMLSSVLHREPGRSWKPQNSR
ncbi:MAG: ORF6N domain-containing protein [Desulfobacteria bacterium]